MPTWTRIIANAVFACALALTLSAQTQWSWPEKPSNLQVFPKDWTGQRLRPEMVEFTRKEPGCRMYIFHQSLENPRNFCFYEQYDDQAAMDAHRNSAHFNEHIKNGMAHLAEKRQAETFEVVS